MSGNSYNKAVKEIIRKAGITKEITLHHLRHSIATHLLESGLNIEYVRDFLGHSHLEATQIYAKVHEYQLKKL
jgi:integrase/recombinase XerD